jgi:hypothetical protein
VPVATVDSPSSALPSDAEALQYRQSLSMSDEDAQFVEQVFDDLDDECEDGEDVSPPPKLPVEVESTGV